MAKYLLGEASAAWLRSQMGIKAPASAKGSTRGGVPTFANEDAFALPFEVRWSATANAWIVWLPDALVTVGTSELDVRTGMTAAGGGYPSGWYKTALDADAGGTLYLTIATEDEVTTATLGVEAVTGAKNIKVAVASVDTQTGARSVKHLVTSAVVIAGGGSGGEEIEQEVITGVSFNVDSTGGIRCYLDKKVIKGVFTIEQESQVDFMAVPVVRVPLVSTVTYNSNGDYKISDTKYSVPVIGESSPIAAAADPDIPTTVYSG